MSLPSPTLLSVGNNYITLFVDTTGLPNMYVNNLISFYFNSASLLTPGIQINTTDASGNYTLLRFPANRYDPLLTSSTAYTITYILAKSSGGYVRSDPLYVTTLNNTPPSTPSLTLVSKTSSSVTLSVSTTGLNGSPFIRCEFRIADSNGTLIENDYTNVIDGAPDASGNYIGTITAPSQVISASAYFRAVLSNQYDDSLSNTLVVGLPPDAPPIPTLLNNGSTSIRVSISTVGLAGAPFTGCVFTASTSGSSFTSTITGSPDASGNYTGTITGLSPPTVSVPSYDVIATLSNSDGSTIGTNLQVTTLNYANRVTLVSKTTNGIIVSGNLSTDTTGAAITGITNVVINYRRISNGTSGTGSVSGPLSGVYTGTLTGLSSSSNYSVYFTFTNGSGDMYSTEPFTIGTESNPVCFKRGSKILCLNKDLKEEYVPVEELRNGDLVKTLKQ